MPKIDQQQILQRLERISQIQPSRQAGDRAIERVRETIMQKSKQQKLSNTKLWRKIMKSPITKVAAIVALAACVTIGISKFKSNALTDTSPAQQEMATLDIKLPRAVFTGTPQSIEGVDNLQPPLGKPRPPFWAPIGAENVAFGKPVVSTDNEPIIGEIEMITDGDKEAADGSYVELGPLAQHVTIDLGAQHDIYAIVLWHFHKQERVYFDVVVQVADDPDFVINVRTLFNNDIDNSSGLGVGKDMHYVETNEGRLIDAGSAQARYVRLFSNGNSNNDLNHYIEVEVFGKPAE